MTAETVVGPGGGAPFGGLERLRWGRGLAPSGAWPALVVMCLLYVIYMIIQSGPRTLSGFSIVVNEAAPVGLAGIGEAVIVLTGGYDLSAGAILGVVNVVLATRTGVASGTVMMVLIGIGCAVGAGMVNGLIVAVLRVPPIIATLGTLFVWEGVALLIMSQPGGTVGYGFSNDLSGSVGGIPVALFLFAAGFLLWRAVKTAPLGRHMYMLGGDPASTRANGVRVGRTLVATYALAGVFYGIAGVYYTASTASGDPNSGGPLLLPIFAAVVLGGIAFGGGRGDCAAALVGAVTLTLISDVLYALGVSSFYTDVFDGAALIVAVAAGVLGGRIVARVRAGRRLSTEGG